MRSTERLSPLNIDLSQFVPASCSGLVVVPTSKNYELLDKDCQKAQLRTLR